MITKHHLNKLSKALSLKIARARTGSLAKPKRQESATEKTPAYKQAEQAWNIFLYAILVFGATAAIAPLLDPYGGLVLFISCTLWVLFWIITPSKNTSNASHDDKPTT